MLTNTIQSNLILSPSKCISVELVQDLEKIFQKEKKLFLAQNLPFYDKQFTIS